MLTLETAALLLLEVTLLLVMVSLTLWVMVAASSSCLGYDLWKHHKFETSSFVKTTFSPTFPS